MDTVVQNRFPEGATTSFIVKPSPVEPLHVFFNRSVADAEMKYNVPQMAGRVMLKSEEGLSRIPEA
jgi:hypothetical protein